MEYDFKKKLIISLIVLGILSIDSVILYKTNQFAYEIEKNIEDINNHIDDIDLKLDNLEQRVDVLEQNYTRTLKK